MSEQKAVWLIEAPDGEIVGSVYDSLDECEEDIEQYYGTGCKPVRFVREELA